MKSYLTSETSKLRKMKKIKKITSVIAMLILLYQFGFLQIISYAAVIDCWTTYQSSRFKKGVITGLGYTTATTHTGKINIQFDEYCGAANKVEWWCWADTTLPSPTNITDTAVNVVAGNKGYFGAQNGSTLTYSNVAYTLNTVYHIEIQVDIPNKTFSAWATPSGSTTTSQICSNFAFRNSNTDDIGNVFFVREAANSYSTITHHMIRPQISSSTSYPSVQYSTSSPYSTTTYLKSRHTALGPNNTANQYIKFDITPDAANMGELVAFAESDLVVGQLSDTAFDLRMNSSGYFDCINGSSYTTGTMAYTSDTEYHVEMIVNTSVKTYSVYVTAPGGARTQIASGAAFRTGGNGANCNDVGEVYFNNGTSGKTYTVENFQMYSLAGATQDNPEIGTVVVGGSTVTPTSFTAPGSGQTIEWVSYDTNKATINSTTGEITGVASGYVTIAYQVVTTATNVITAYGSLEILVMENQSAPSAGLFTAYSATTEDNNNGYITGTTTAMEYSINGGGSYTTCSGTSITGLAAGDVLIRYAAKTGYYASPATTVNIPNQEQAAPTGLSGVSATTEDNNDGKITGTTTAMEYKLKSGSIWTTCSATETTGLAAGEYEVRYAAKTGFNVGTPADVTIPNQDQFPPNGLHAVAETSYGADDGKITGTTTAMEYKLVSGSVWTQCSNTETTGLAEGLYEVRYAAKTGYNAGSSTYLTIGVEFHNLEVTLSKGVSDMTVNLEDWDPDHMYQIWTYQKITTDVLLDTELNVKNNQWIISKEYTLGSDYDSQGPGGSINFVIDDFQSPDYNYSVIVEILDSNGNYLGNVKESFTPADLGIAVINKVYVDGEYSALQKYETKEIKTGAEVLIEVVANDAPDIVYTATVEQTGATISSVDSDNNFQWDISSMVPGKYTVEIYITNGVSTDTRNIIFYLFDMDYSISSFASLSDMTITDVGSGDYDIVPTFAGGDFYYSIEEPNRNPFYKYPGTITPAQFASMGGKITHNLPDYGIYYIYGFVKRTATAIVDNMIYKVLTIPRSVSPSTIEISADESNPVTKGTKITFTASATIAGIGATPVLYSFFKEDASGSHLVKDWSASNTLEWTAAKVGEYAIIARAKGIDAGSMEVEGRIGVRITDQYEVIAEDVVITVNETELDNIATVRKPVETKASATSSNSDKLLYKFSYIDDLTGGVILQDYSPDRTCTWVPERSGACRVLVWIKNSASYGISDKTKVIDITVNS